MGHRIGRPQNEIDDPGLPPDFGDDPARLERDDGREPGCGDGPQEPAGRRVIAMSYTQEETPRAEEDQGGPDANHRIPGQVDDRRRGSLVDGDGVESGDHRVWAEPGQQRRDLRDLDPTDNAPIDEDAPDRFGLVRAADGDQLHRGELGRLVLEDASCGDVADHHLEWRGDSREDERDGESEPDVAIGMAPQQAHRIDGRQQEPGHHVARQEHVRDLVDRRSIEDDLEGGHGGDSSIRSQDETRRLVHPGIGRHHRERPADACHRHRDAAQQVGSRRGRRQP